LATLNSLYTRHDRAYRSNRYVYPVLSRRSGGISVGINLNPEKGCTFDCIYCQVDRTPKGMQGLTSLHQAIDTGAVLEELERMMSEIHSGALFLSPPFSETPLTLRKLTDISLSGDGEPTAVPEFLPVLQAVVDWRKDNPLGKTVPVRLITNGTGLFDPVIRSRVNELLFPSGRPSPDTGEIWFKIDAADPENFFRIDRTPLDFPRYWNNVTETVLVLPVTIQTIVLDIDDPDRPFRPEGRWAEAMQVKIRELLDKGARIVEWHLYTVARKPAESSVKPLSRERLEALKESFSRVVPVTIAIFP
jgi:wyosine [tRNA(Phe)-imidazoG37] synthetase (radical SAM superfamily)